MNGDDCTVIKYLLKFLAVIEPIADSNRMTLGYQSGNHFIDYTMETGDAKVLGIVKLRQREDMRWMSVKREMNQLLKLRAKTIQIDGKMTDTQFTILTDGSQFIFFIYGSNGTFYTEVTSGNKKEIFQMHIPSVTENKKEEFVKTINKIFKALSRNDETTVERSIDGTQS